MLAMIAMADADHDGSISLDEFYHLASTLAEVEQLKSGGCAVGKSIILVPRLPQPALRALPSILFALFAELLDPQPPSTHPRMPREGMARRPDAASEYVDATAPHTPAGPRPATSYGAVARKPWQQRRGRVRR
jgi:hypothetical protein